MLYRNGVFVEMMRMVFLGWRSVVIWNIVIVWRREVVFGEGKCGLWSNESCLYGV